MTAPERKRSMSINYLNYDQYTKQLEKQQEEFKKAVKERAFNKSENTEEMMFIAETIVMLQGNMTKTILEHSKLIEDLIGIIKKQQTQIDEQQSWISELKKGIYRLCPDAEIIDSMYVHDEDAATEIIRKVMNLQDLDEVIDEYESERIERSLNNKIIPIADIYERRQLND